MLINTWLLFMAVAILPVLSPGPGMLLAISNSLRFGPQATFYSALGNSLGLTALGLFVAFGLAAILEVSAAAFTILKIIGALYLAYLGIKLWRDGKAISLPGDIVPVMSRAKLFRQAFLLSCR
jgi:homoserine/homoserine lactone efflux protein